MLTDEQIEAGKAATAYTDDPHHEDNDCIRLAYEWLDAQQTVASKGRKHLALKHVIQKWAGRYISATDVEVAATLHPRIKGTYPAFNLSARMTRPNDRRLAGIAAAGTHPNYREVRGADVYSREEP